MIRMLILVGKTIYVYIRCLDIVMQMTCSISESSDSDIWSMIGLGYSTAQGSPHLEAATVRVDIERYLRARKLL